MSESSNKHVLAVERRCAGFKVIAGPFTVSAVQRGLRVEEQRRAARVLADQKAAGIAAKIVMYRGEAYVLRSETGWREQDGNSETRTIKASMLRCPLCHCGPFTEMALRLHGCARKPMVMINGCLRRGRLDGDEIERVKAERSLA